MTYHQVLKVRKFAEISLTFFCCFFLDISQKPLEAIPPPPPPPVQLELSRYNLSDFCDSWQPKERFYP